MNKVTAKQQVMQNNMYIYNSLFSFIYDTAAVFSFSDRHTQKAESSTAFSASHTRLARETRAAVQSEVSQNSTLLSTDT